jgi:hypothetical protein
MALGGRDSTIRNNREGHRIAAGLGNRRPVEPMRFVSLPNLFQTPPRGIIMHTERLQIILSILSRLVHYI